MRTHIKICGITSLKDALAAIEAGADLLGFNFYPPSPRSLSAPACRGITSILQKDFPHILLVGVFVNSPTPQVRAVLQTAGLHLAQLHGDEPPQAVSELAPLAFKALRLSASASQPEHLPFLADCLPALLVDSFSAPGVYGGSGAVANWQAAAALARQHSILLAGGLTPQNAAEAVRQVQPWGLDVASGVEASPGVKDPYKMRDFIQAARAAD